MGSVQLTQEPQIAGTVRVFSKQMLHATTRPVASPAVPENVISVDELHKL